MNLLQCVALGPALAAEPAFIQTRSGALVVWERSDGEIVAQALDRAFDPEGDPRTIAPAEPGARPAPAIAARTDGAWVLAREGGGWRAHRVDSRGATDGAPWDLDLGEVERPAIAGDDRTLFVALEGEDDVYLGRWISGGAPSLERVVPLPRGQDLLGIALRDREVHVASAGADGQGLAIRSLPRDLSEEGHVVATDAGARGARWAQPTAFAHGVAAIAAAGPFPIAVLFRPGRGARVVEIALGARDVRGATIAPWAGAGFASWTIDGPGEPVAAVRALGETLTPEGPVRCVRGFEGASVVGLLPTQSGAAVGWAARAPGGSWRIAIARAGQAVRWIAGERVETLAPAGRLEPAHIGVDGSVRLPGRRRAIAVAELVGAGPPIVATASRRGESIVAYAAVVDGRRRIRVIRVDRRGRTTPPWTISHAAPVEAEVSVEWTAPAAVVRWLEERGRSTVAAEATLDP